MSDAVRDVTPGVFGDYVLQGLLGRGGMGEVHRAYDTRRGRQVALKLLPPHLAGDRTLVERFRREARALVRLTDPYIVPVHDFGEIDGRLFIDMALIDGRDVADILATDGRLEPARAVHLVDQAARALDTAHRHGVVHRDVKPSNLLVLPDRGDFTYLVDFGIAHAVGSLTLGTSLTATGSTVGTLAFMAPERFVAEHAVDGRVDVYALACVLFLMLTGEPPFPFEGAPAMLNAHLNLPAPAVTLHRPQLSPVWDRVIARGMAKDPADRHPTAGALAADARAALFDRPPAPPRPAVPVVRPGVPDAVRTRPVAHRPQGRRSRGPVLILGIVLAVAALAGGRILLYGTSLGPDRGTVAAAPTTAPAAVPGPLSAPASESPTYATYRAPGGAVTIDLPTELTRVQSIADGTSHSTPNGSVTVDVTTAPRRDATPQTLLADRVAALEGAGGTVTRSAADADSFTLAGTDRDGRAVAVGGRKGGNLDATVSWTYPPSEEARWASFVQTSIISLNPR